MTSQADRINSWKRFTSLAVVAAAAVAASAPAAIAQPVELDDLGHFVGDPTARVQVVEFSDFGCSACGQFGREVKPRLFREYVATGRVAWRMIPIRLAGYRHAAAALKAAECAAEQGAFWKLEPFLFQEQARWQSERNPEPVLRELATAAGLRMEAWVTCFGTRRWDDPTRTHNRAARRMRVRGTPTFFVDGRPVIGALGYGDFGAILDSALADTGP